MKILHVIRDLSPATGGPVTAVLGMAKQQARMGHAVTIASTDYGIEKPAEIEGVKVQIYPLTFALWRWSKGLSVALSDLVRVADMVHIHMLWEHPTYAAAAACRKMKKPYIIRPCGMLDRWSLSQRAWKKKVYLTLFLGTILDHAAAVHYTSEGERRQSSEFAGGCKSFVIPVGLPSSAYEDHPHAQAFWARFPALYGKRLVLFLGRLHYKKQPEVAIKAFADIAPRIPNGHLVMTGPGDAAYVSGLKQLVADLGLNKQVTFTGMLRGEAVREAYRAAELFVLPSLQENFGIAVAEAMAAGCPVVVSDRVDLSPEIAKAEAGLVCSPNVGETASAMNRLLEDEGLRTRMGENGQRLALEKFAWEKVATALTQVYEDILSGEYKSPDWKQH